MSIDKLEQRVETLETVVQELKNHLGEVVTIIGRVQWIASGMFLYYILENLGFTSVLKLLISG